MQIERHALFWVLAALVFGGLLALLAPVLLPFVVGLVLAYFLNPLVDGLSALSIPRWLSAVIILVLSTLLLVALFVFLVPVLAQQTDGLIATLPGEIARLKGLLETFARERLGARFPEAEAAISRGLNGMQDSLPGMLSGFAKALWSQGTAAFNFFSLMLVTPLVFFYALVDWPQMVAKVDSWLPRKHAPTIRALATEIDSRVSAFIRGQGMVCIVLALFYGIALSLLGLRYGLLIGLLTGILSFIPFAGWALGLITATALAAVQYWPDMTSILLVPGVFLAGQALDAAVLSPQIVGQKIGLHPVWLIFALLTFSYLFGFLGLLVAVPVAAAIGVLVRFGLRTYLESSVYHGHDAAKG
ncbi:MAG: AI-2E family transporter [Hyphomicrobium sp.]|nr:AI-2E family transporter [Hyphomicrobium sp.]